MQLLLALLVCLGLSGSTWGWRLPYIVNGRDATVGEFPWPVWYRSYFKVVLGAHDIDTREKGDPQTFSIEKFVAHPDFKFGLSDPDIGLIKLAKDATLDGTYVDNITLATADVGDLAGADCVITGWGNTKVGSTHPANILQAANTKPLTYAACEALAKDMPGVGAGIINNGHICIGAVNVEGSCHGDSGGPLVCKLADGSKVLAGATSWGSPKCKVNYPTVYSRVSNFRKWLSDNSGGEV